MHSHATVEKNVVHWRTIPELILNYFQKILIYLSIVSISGYPDKAYLINTEEEFKKRYYNHIKNETKKSKTTLAKYIWKLKQKLRTTPSLKRYTVKFVPYSLNITKRCMVCRHQKIEILTSPKVGYTSY